MSAEADRRSGKTLEMFNVVLVCDNFPVASIDLSEITFRGRKFQEQLRIGPTLQAATRNVQLFILPDRVQVTVQAPDDLDILAEGVQEVVDVLREYVGRRAVTAVGHNAQAFYTAPGGSLPFHDHLVQMDAMRQLVGMASVTEASVTVLGKVGRESALRVTTGTEAETGRGVLDLNFDFQLKQNAALTLDDAIAELPSSLRHAVDIQRSFAARASTGQEVLS